VSACTELAGAEAEGLKRGGIEQGGEVLGIGCHLPSLERPAPAVRWRAQARRAAQLGKTTAPERC